MPAITFDRFDGGLDVRQLASSADANRLRMLKNAYVTTGRTIRKHPGLKRLGSLNSGSFGLFGGVDALWTFSAFGGDHAQFPQIKNSRIREPYGKNMARLIHAEVFNGFVYAVVECEDGSIEHHYLDGKYDTLIQDANCPHSRSLIKKAGKLFAIKNDVVRFSATGKGVNALGRFIPHLPHLQQLLRFVHHAVVVLPVAGVITLILAVDARPFAPNRIHILIGHIHRPAERSLEAGIGRAGFAHALLGHNQLQHVVGVVFGVVAVAVVENHGIRILLNRAGIAQVAQSRAFVGAFLTLAGELGQHNQRHIQLLGQNLALAGIRTAHGIRVKTIPGGLLIVNTAANRK